MLTEKLDQPFSISYTPYTLRCVFTFTIAYALGIGIYYSQKRNYRRGVEHGSAKWGDAASICKRYRDKRYTQNLILTQNFRMGLDCYKHKRNLNVLVVGGSGAGKSRAYAVVNIMQCNCSMVVTDPKGELLRKTGGLLEREGYEVRVFDLINPETSFCYNPFAYVRDDKDVFGDIFCSYNRKILRMKFNEKLIEIRKKQGLSQEELGMELQVSRQIISKWETGVSLR